MRDLRSDHLMCTEESKARARASGRESRERTLRVGKIVPAGTGNF